MNRTALVASLAVLVAVAVSAAFFGSKEGMPIIDEACQEGYTRLGEGCVRLKEACDAGGEQYYFDAIANECRTRQL